jgi:hypothetical protein
VALVAGGAPRTWANFTVTTIFHENVGFPGVCTAPCFSVEKTVNFYDAGSASDPGYCAATEDTYVYTLLHLGGSLPPPNVPVTELELSIQNAPTTVAAASWDATVPFPGDVDPLSATISPLELVNYGFPGTPSCPTCLNQGQTSAPLFLCADAATTDPITDPDTANCSIGAGILGAPCETVVPGPALACDDSLDNDGDGLTDYPDDPGCADALDASEKDDTAAYPCDDGVDNEPVPDGLVDFRADGSGDPGCRSPYYVTESPQCQDGINNDAQEGIDFDGGQSIHGACSGAPGGCPPGVSDPEGDGIANPDAQCVGKPWRMQELQPRPCGLGTEMALLVPPLMWLSRRRGPRV